MAEQRVISKILDNMVVHVLQVVGVLNDLLCLGVTTHWRLLNLVLLALLSERLLHRGHLSFSKLIYPVCNLFLKFGVSPCIVV